MSSIGSVGSGTGDLLAQIRQQMLARAAAKTGATPPDSTSTTSGGSSEVVVETGSVAVVGGFTRRLRS